MEKIDPHALLKSARQHEANAKRHPTNTHINGWHAGCASVYYEILKKIMSWDEYRAFIDKP